MSGLRRIALAVVTVALVRAGIPAAVCAGEVGHFAAGSANIRDYVVPDPGFYLASYNYFYTTGQTNDAQGNEVSSVTIPDPPIPGKPRLRLKLDVDVNIYAAAPMLMWVSDWTFLGAKYAAYVVPTFANTSLSAALTTETGRGINPSTSSFGVGDLFVQPVWLGWTLEHFDVAFGMGFYAPVGKYHVDTVHVPTVGAVKVDSASNIGLGFWTQQTQIAGTWYPWAHRATALALALTHEVNTKKQDFDLTPGQNLTLNWGLSQYVPLDQAQTLLLEVGPAGYDTWQVTHDTGSAAATPNVLDQVHAAGGQVGLTYVPWGLAVSFHAFQEFAAKDRFQGDVFGLNAGKKF